MTPAALWRGVAFWWRFAKGFRLRPWKSPYIQWRMETFFGQEAAGLDARKFFRLMWRERAQMERFLEWVRDMRRELKRPLP